MRGLCGSHNLLTIKTSLPGLRRGDVAWRRTLFSEIVQWVGHCGYANSQYDHAIEFGLDLGGGQLEYTESGNLGGCRCNTGWELGGGQLEYTESWNLGGCRCNTVSSQLEYTVSWNLGGCRCNTSK